MWGELMYFKHLAGLVIRIESIVLAIILSACNPPRQPAVVFRSKLTHPATKQAIYGAVVEEIAIQLGQSKEAIRPARVFWQQPGRGDALDIVEAVMAIEERLIIEIADSQIDAAVGKVSVNELPRLLKVSALQEIVWQAYKKARHREGKSQKK